MPGWLKELLETDGQAKAATRDIKLGKTRSPRLISNYMSGVVPVLARLLNQDATVEQAFLCGPEVQHVSKLSKEGKWGLFLCIIYSILCLHPEGGFCGYRNIQMMASYIIGTKSQGSQKFQGNVPTIFQIQDNIEHAWDMGFNAQGRIETGGIRGTRKYIGTQDVSYIVFAFVGTILP